ncbi:hypothetical protein BJY24_000149 [Nocardia transvalensis]|uniref:DUF3099 domain-containing protein n=1 Tax=Nocardia transvalensis TaxID=37333 RepID=A0A7W9UFM8_9NOCA|nr:DUF3099 domain-containing protein [Nocardia transvalensis]MBB5911282.1 hypothetical protein [Nocardia transvalensis]
MQRDGESPDAEDRDGEVRPEFERLPPGSIPRPPRRSEGYFPGQEEQRPVLITEAAPSLEQQHRARVRRYTAIMAFRIPCLILAAVAYGLWANPLISLAIIGVSIPLPWVAVLIANDRPPRRKDEPSRWDERRAAKAL